MQFTHRLLPGSAAGYALLLLAPLIAFSQDESAPETHGIVVTNMDRSVKPGDDFYRYANGDWIKRTEIPTDRGYIDPYGGDYEDDSNDLTRKRIAGLIDEAAKADGPAGSNLRKIADLYNSYMDVAAIEARGLAPLRPHLDAIAAIRDKHELARALGESLRAGRLNTDSFHTPNLFKLWVGPGFNDPKHYAAYLLQGGLELPDREYYLSDSGSMRDLRSLYQTHVSAMLKLASFADTEVRAQHIIELEHAIAEQHAPLADQHNIYKANNTWKQADFAANAGGFDWRDYFRGAGLSGQVSFIVWQPSAVTGESALVASVALDTWKDWLAFHFIEDYSAELPKALADEHFAFFGKALFGSTEQPLRRLRSVALVNSVLGDALGREYARRYFSAETKAQIQVMVANIIAAYRRRIDALPWMDLATKAEAQAKLTTLYVGIGYPETWRDYSSYEVKADDIFGNI